MIGRFDEQCLRQQLDWAKRRVSALDAIEQHLCEMRKIALAAESVALDQVERDALNLRMQMLCKTVQILDEQSRS